MNPERERFDPVKCHRPLESRREVSLVDGGPDPQPAVDSDNLRIGTEPSNVVSIRLDQGSNQNGFRGVAKIEVGPCDWPCLSVSERVGRSLFEGRTVRGSNSRLSCSLPELDRASQRRSFLD